MTMQGQNEEAEIVKRVLSGDLESYGTIIDKYEKKLLRFVMLISKASKEDAEDIIQDTFISAYQNLADFDTKMSFSAWIYKIARNKAISWYRKNTSKKAGEKIELKEEVFLNLKDDAPSILEELHAKAATDKLLEEIEKLDSKYKEVIILKYFEHKSYLEIADILHIPPGSVASTLYRAKAKLKEKLKNAYEE